MVDFIYDGEVKVGREDLHDFLSAAEGLQLKGLSQGYQTGQHNNDELIERQESHHINQETKIQTESFNDKEILSTPQAKHSNNIVDNNGSKHPILTDKISSFLNTYKNEAIPSGIQALAQNIEQMIIQKSTGVFRCKLCEMRSIAKIKVMRHVQSKHSDVVLHGCPLCEKKFNSKENVDKHINSMHNRPQEVGGILTDAQGR